MTAKWPIYIVVAIAVGATGFNLAYHYCEKDQNRELSVSSQALRASMIQLQSELRAIKGQLDELSKAHRAHAPAPAGGSASGSERPTHKGVASRANNFPFRFAFQSNSEAAFGSAEATGKHTGGSDKTREDLEGLLSSTKD